MSLELSVDDKPLGDVATNLDWEEFAKIATGEAKKLVKQGYTKDLDGLFADLEKMVKKNKKRSLTETLKKLKDAAGKGGDILIVSS